MLNLLSIIIAFSLIIIGISHFPLSNFLVTIVPPYLPLKLTLVYLTGILEIILGILIFFKATRRYALYLTLAMLISYLPVHIYMLTESEVFIQKHHLKDHMPYPIVLFYLRLLAQFLMIFGLYKFIKSNAIDGK
jgi:uncharacterized membrane protein